MTTRATSRPSALLAAAVAVAALAAGCGSEDDGRPIPGDVAARLQQRLDVVERQLEAGGGACADIQEKTFPVIEQDVSAIPDDVDADVRSALERSLARLRDLAASQCEEQREQEPPAETTPPPEPPVPTETETTPTETERQEDEDRGPPGQEKKDDDRGGGKKEPGGEDGGGAPGPPGGD